MAGGAVSLAERAAARVLGPRIPAGELPHPLPPGVTVRRCGWIPRIGGWLMGGDRRPAGGVTLGRTILLPPGSTPSAPLMAHELVHVAQWRADPLFPLRYALATLRHGYRGNPYEVEAYARQAEHAAANRTNPQRTP